VVNVSPEGELLELVIKEMVDPDTLPEETVSLLRLTPTNSTAPERPAQEDMYTFIKLNGNKYDIFQEIAGTELPESRGTYKKDMLPYQPLTWEKESGEFYGRSYIEQYVGDLISTEGLSKAHYDYAAVASKVIFLNRPNGSTKTRTLTDAKNGEVISGDADDVHALMVGKMQDMQGSKALLDDIIQRLGLAFVSQSSVQRQAERVTAEEIRMMAEMLDQQLGGVYARFSMELQRPLATLVIKGLEASNRIEKIPQDALKVQIITGIDALGRG